MIDARLGFSRSFRYVRLYWPVVIRGRIALLLCAYLMFLGVKLIATLAEGGARSAVVKQVVIIPAMFLIALCFSDLVPSLRAEGSLELVVTLAKPHLFLLHRAAPLIAVVVGQVLLVVPFMLYSVGLLAAIGGVAGAMVPLAYSFAISIYWNMRLKSGGAVLAASVACLIPAVIWLDKAHLFPDEGTVFVPLHEVWLSSIGCQAGLLTAALATGAVAWRRFGRPDKLLESQ